MNTVSQKARTIRYVIASEKRSGAPKKARDKKTKRTAERIRAMSTRTCDSSACPWPDRIIGQAGERQYIRMTGQDSTYIGRHAVPVTKDYHPDCVPEIDRPLVRLLIGFGWIAETCNGFGPPLTTRAYTTPMAWQMHHDALHPNWRKVLWRADRERMQIGTGYHWSVLTRYTGRKV